MRKFATILSAVFFFLMISFSASATPEQTEVAETQTENQDVSSIWIYEIIDLLLEGPISHA